ncbi:hypothetical protein DIPPA_12486 [Diplonema papillatum]|nr:hypothetical protein DIPPA_12486 [Diplonema papillatum]
MSFATYMKQFSEGFLSRFTEVLKEGHSVIGILPGCYDGWLLDYEGEVRDPFTRTERILALGMKAACDYMVRYASEAVMEWLDNRVVLPESGIVGRIVQSSWDTAVVSLVSSTVSYVVGPARCKAILQKDWNFAGGEEGAEERHTKAVAARVWAFIVVVAGAALVYKAPKDTKKKKIQREWISAFLVETIFTEPLMMSFALALSLVLRRPVSGVSFAYRGITPSVSP